MVNKAPITYMNAYVSTSGSRWIVASNPTHYSGQPEALEIHDDGTVTQYNYAGRLMPALGSVGKLEDMKEGTTLKHVTTRKEREQVAHKERLIELGKQASQMQYDMMKMGGLK